MRATLPANTTDTTGGDKSGRTLTLTAEDMQRKKNDVKARTTLLLSFPDEHQLRFNKYKTARELWAVILKTFGGNEATKKTKKNLLKQQYGNFKAEGSKTLEQTFNRLQVIIVWRNRSDLNTMSLDDLYNNLKVYESEVQKKPEQNSQNMAFISSAKHSSRNKDGNTASVPTASTNVPTASASVATISQDTACAYIASQSSDRFWKKTGKKISIQGSDVAGFDKSKVECFNCHKMGHFARECRAPRSQDRGRRDNFRQGSKAKEQALKALIAIDGVGWDWSYMANDEEDHALVADEVTPTEFALMANTSAESKVFDNSLCSKDCKKNNDSLNNKITDLTDKLFDANNFIYHYKLALAQVESRLVEYKEREVKYIEKIRTLEYYNESYKECNGSLKKKLETLQQEKEGVDGKLAGLLTALKDLDNLIESQRPSPTAKCISEDDQNRNTFVSETVASPITSKPFIKFVRPKDSQSDSKTDKNETPKKPPVKPVHRTSAVRSPSRAPWVSTVNRNYSPVNRKFSTGSRNFPTANRKFPTASRKFPTGSTKSITADMGLKGKAGSSQNKINDKGYWDSEGTETLEQTFNRLQVIVSQLPFMDVEIKKDDLNQKFLTSLAPEWLMHTIVWRNRNDLDSMSLDDLYNHLKVYKAEVHKKPNLNSQDMAFISSSKNSNNKDGNTVCVTTATTAFPTGSVNVVTISEDTASAFIASHQDTASAFIASQSNGSQIKFEDINQIDEDDMEEIDIKWNMALLSMRADKFRKRTGKKISIQGSDVAGFNKSKVECFNCHKMGYFARECRAPKSQERVPTGSISSHYQ
nr:hypothetical protein [Tanacetum cinerariifolium]